MATVRKSAYKISADEQKAYKDGITAMIADGSYADLVSIHTNMSHHMHTMNDPPDDPHGIIGGYRFLPWHRAYLVEMEAQLKASSKNPKVFVPYWNWIEGGIPDWMVDFKPQVPKVKDVDEGKTLDVDNNRKFDPAKAAPRKWPPTKKDIDDVLANDRYETFTADLESFPHNAGHRVLGYPMTSLRSPAEPIFWMHHAAVDRVWASWQKSNKGKDPYLTGKYLKMDPWNARTVEKLRDIGSLGYSYDSLP